MRRIPKRSKAASQSVYDVYRDPKDGLYYVIGKLKGRTWMKVSQGFKTSGEAWARVKHQKQADASMRTEIKGWAGGQTFVD